MIGDDQPVILDGKSMFIFSKDSSIREKIIKIVSSSYFYFFYLLLILLTSIRIALMSPFIDPNSD